jgi:predicted alpha/beta superfamily hydrolase
MTTFRQAYSGYMMLYIHDGNSSVKACRKTGGSLLNFVPFEIENITLSIDKKNILVCMKRYVNNKRHKLTATTKKTQALMDTGDEYMM